MPLLKIKSIKVIITAKNYHFKRCLQSFLTQLFWRCQIFINFLSGQARQRAFFLLDTFLFCFIELLLKESLKCNKSSFFMWWHLAGKIFEYLLREKKSDTEKEISGKHFPGVNEPKSRYPDSAQPGCPHGQHAWLE